MTHDELISECRMALQAIEDARDMCSQYPELLDPELRVLRRLSANLRAKILFMSVAQSQLEESNHE